MQIIKSRAVFPLRSAVGFSMIELMVVVSIIAGLALIGIPQYRKFVAGSRQAEAKKILAEIHTLQSAYQLEKERYAAWAETESYGYRTEGSANECGGEGSFTDHKSKALGLKINGCENLRYRYYVVRKDEVGTTNTELFHAVAVAHGDDTKRIYPNCAGTVATAQYAHPTSTENDLKSTTTVDGDVHGISEGKVWKHHKNIIETCE